METECCPLFDPDIWDEKVLSWPEKKFVKDKVFCLFHVPVGFGATMKRIMRKMQRTKAECVDGLCLSDHTSKWNMDIYVAVDKDLPESEMQHLDGQFLFRVYEGPFSDTGKWCADFSEYARRRGIEIEKLYMWYTTCPKCAKKRGKNHVAVVGKLSATSIPPEAVQPD